MISSQLEKNQGRRGNFLYKNLLLIIGIAILIIVLYQLGLQNLYSVIISLDPMVIAALYIMAILNSILLALRWSYLLGRMDIKPRFNAVLKIVTFTYLANYVLSKIGDTFLRPVLLKNKNQADYDLSLATTIFERMIDMSIISLISILFFYFFIEKSFIILIPIFILFFVLREKIVRYFPKKIRTRLKIRQLWHNFNSLIKPKPLFINTAFTATLFALEFGQFFVILYSLFPTANPLMVLGLFYTSFIIGVISMIPGGLGTSELSMVALSGLVGIPFELALISFLCYRAFNIIGFGTIYLFTWR